MPATIDLASFEAGAREAAFNIAAGWDYAREVKDAVKALQKFNRQIDEMMAAKKENHE